MQALPSLVPRPSHVFTFSVCNIENVGWPGDEARLFPDFFASLQS